MENEKLYEIRKNKMGTPMKIINYRSRNDIDIEFLDDFHYIKEHQTYSNFKNGSIKNPYDKTVCGVGYIGVGKYPVSINKKLTIEYQNWACMLRRCYDEKLKEKYSSYFGKCTVCEEWHNFQVFAKWYNENIYQVGTERMHIDKDILFENSKLYSPETCLIVPQRINMLFVEKRGNKSNLPTGINCMPSGKYSSCYNGKHLGIYNTIGLAAIAHDTEKKKNIIKVANEYKNVIPNKLYESLINWSSNYI
jgi:hypothetical protein